MTQQAKLFLAEERGHSETDWFRSYNTFNFGGYVNEHKTPAAHLYVCNDDTLAGGRSFSLSVNEPTLLILIPVAGAIQFTKKDGAGTVINAGEVYSTHLKKGEGFEISNPYETELVNFLQYWIKVPETDNAAEQLVSFNINLAKNAFIHLPLAIPVHIAKLDGRRELIYETAAEKNCVFAFIIQGAFETEGVLLHARDGAAFWNYRHAAIEALSNDAIILLVEMNGC